mmetsp:Transcript_9381/g.15307  ORF Transcript_9381/g.15307 Transcript_9381/m.15307 type:complete len:211 (+) Transcript_9381:403-1035(+)
MGKRDRVRNEDDKPRKRKGGGKIPEAKLMKDADLLASEIKRLEEERDTIMKDGSGPSSDVDERLDRIRTRVQVLRVRMAQLKGMENKQHRQRKEMEEEMHQLAKLQPKQSKNKQKFAHFQGQHVAVGGSGDIPLPNAATMKAPPPPGFPEVPLRKIPPPPETRAPLRAVPRPPLLKPASTTNHVEQSTGASGTGVAANIDIGKLNRILGK